MRYDQSVAPDGPSMPPPIKRKRGSQKIGGAGRQAVRRTSS
jgi:hypothetical protein